MVYISKQLRPHKKNHPIHDLDLAIVVFTLKIWRHYHTKFEVLSDQKSLKYLLTFEYEIEKIGRLSKGLWIYP